MSESEILENKNTAPENPAEEAEKAETESVSTKPVSVKDDDEDDEAELLFSEPDYNAPPAVEFEDVTKKYYLYKSEKSRFKAMFTGNRGVDRHSALNGVSFKIYPGESVGFIGRNGAGKSTVLKMITGVSYPTSGDITVRGKVAAMLELTAGFYPDMTGRENIYMKGYLLGLTEEDINEIEEDVIDFAELDEYIDQPVRTYSSGMKMRLGFAININIRPDVLVVDEALSVGDSRFRKKCTESIRELIKSGVTVLFVSHSPSALLSTCTRAIYLKDGKVAFDGDIVEALEIYNKDVEEIRRRRKEKRKAQKRLEKKALAKKKKQKEAESAET